MKSQARKAKTHPGSTRPSLPAYLSTGKLEAATACFARDACLLTPDATAIHGRESIRPLLAQLIAQRPRIEIEFSNVLVGDEVAFVQERWRVRTAGAEGSKFERTLESTQVLRQIEGHWKIVIAAPWGWRNGAALRSPAPPQAATLSA